MPAEQSSNDFLELAPEALRAAKEQRMTQTQLEAIARRLLANIAPEADLEGLDPDRAYRDQFAFDSVDCLRFALALEKALEIEIPEAAYPRLGTLNGCLSYLQERLSAV
ncbi:MAG: phosphopantetheine-binding protein [Desulfobacterales bacterium]|jgi:acyl carrier protein|nr:phosphopantetheine-binding protein [Desulfobacterales bacterium]